VYEWTAENLSPFLVESESPSLRYYEPHLVCYVSSYDNGKGRVEVLSDVKTLHQWYRSFIAAVDEAPHPALAQVIADIKARNKREEDVAKAIFYWVQDNIQYIAFEDGMRGIIPHKPSYTCDKRYGDCKDMATLLVAMLKIAGIEKAYPTWIGTRDIPYRYSEFPTPYVDNHMIATYVSPAGKYYFLDATDKFATFGYPSSMTQGKEALISVGTDQFELKEVPVIEPDGNLITDSLTVSLEENLVKGEGRITLKGLSKSSVGHQFGRVEEQDVKDFVVHMAGKGSNKFYLDQYRISQNDVKDSPTQIDYSFRIGDYFQRLGDELYVNLNLSKDNYNRTINEKTRTTPHEFEYQYRKSEYINFNIPEGYTVEYLPENQSFKGELLGFDISYRVNGKIIEFRKSYSIHYLLMTPEKFATWNEEVSRLSESYRETVILKKATR